MDTKEQKSTFQLAREFHFGQNGQEVDLEKALEFYEIVANDESSSDQSKALYELGRLYEYGQIVEQDFTRAMGYFNKSAELGNADATYELGFMWSTGKGVPINKPLSILYYTLAAKAGHTYAALTLGYKFSMGHDVLKSCAKAATKYEIVARIVSELKPYDIFNGDIHYLSDSAEIIRERSKEEDVIQYYQFSADSGDTSAQVMLGTLHLKGSFGVAQDYRTAFRYFEQAANRGDLTGISHLGFMYANGLGTEQNNETAVRLYREAADKGNPQAQTNLGYMYWHGYHVPQDFAEAFRFFKSAADQGFPEAQVNLGSLYYSGEGVKQDYAKAFTYFQQAAQHGNLVAIFNLAEMHHHGLGTAPSCTLAVQLYKRVAEKGPWTRELEDAYALYTRHEYEAALIRYEKAAEWGYEIAQANAGLMYDTGLGISNSTNSTRYQLAFEYFRNSAEQKSPESHLKIGDYYFYGLGTSQSYEKAAVYYQAASEMRNAQAIWNLGYMHQHGLGLPKDLHLAKRNFDHALAVDKDAWLAVYLSLLGIGYEFAVQLLQTTDFIQLVGVEWDTLLILLLGGILAILVVIRQALALGQPRPVVQ